MTTSASSRFRLSLLAAASAAFLAACGGDSAPDRGSLIEPPATVTTLTAAQIDAATAATGLQALSGKARCDVKVVALNYQTVGPKQEETNASGAMFVPGGSCTGASALVAYGKGTDVQKPRTLANPSEAEAMLLIAVYAAQGYTVVASDYLGYAKSAFGYHPYLHADSEATTLIDAIRAARNAAKDVGANLSGKVMLTGYSQGGHVSMATQRNGERDHAAELNIVAGAHLSGPYNLSGSVKLPVVIAGYQYFVPFLITSWQKVYGDVYRNVGDVFKAPYASYIETLLPNPTLNFTTLATSGQLPGGKGETPTQARDAMFQAAFVTDLATNPNNGVVVASRRNDLLGWTPKAPVFLCGGAGDPTVPPAVHRDVLRADFAARGVTNVSSADVDAQVQLLFGPGGRAPTDPTSAAFGTYYANYHGTYVPPLCHAQARVFFDALK
ncbi:MAG: lipase family protein [Rubrivivax sp.]